MSLVTETEAAISDDPHILEDIVRPGCNIAIWKRALPFDPTPLLSASLSDAIRITVSADSPTVALEHALSENGFAGSKTREALVNDIVRLCALFRPVAGTPRIEVRLELVTGNACRKFHGDYVTSRLITTYSGPGTQWLHGPDVERVTDGLEPIAIQQMAPGDVGIFKGRLSTPRPAIHRSPPIEGTDQTRLIVVLNPEDKDDLA